MIVRKEVTKKGKRARPIARTLKEGKRSKKRDRAPMSRRGTNLHKHEKPKRATSQYRGKAGDQLRRTASNSTS